MSALCQKRTYALQQITDSLGQMLTNFGQEFARAKWFGYVIITAGGLRSLLRTVERVRGDRDDRDRSQGRIRLDPARGGVTVHYRELDVHQDKIRPLFCDRSERLFAVFGFDNLIICR